MKYGLIGEKLGHSFSKEVHGQLADYQYQLMEIAKCEFDAFASKKNFAAINVTIPYKEQIIPYLDYIDPIAAQIGAVNTVVNRDGKLYGYNTDFYGMESLAHHAGVCFKDKKVIILGTGGTSKTARAVALAGGAKSVYRVSRSGKDGAITYEQLYTIHADADIIVNTTPCGMYPNIDDSAVDLNKFNALSGVLDAVYNPLNSKLVLSAKQKGIPSEGGLYMLIAQAVKASEIFLDRTYTPSVLDEIYKKIYTQKQNIVLVGMPSSGKSTVGAILADKLGRNLIDTDAEIVKTAGKEITSIFAAEGEEGFRDRESTAVLEASRATSSIISTGGGAILRTDNVAALKSNGRIYFIDRPLVALLPTEDRPLASSEEMIKKRYIERYDIYSSVCDVKINADCAAEQVAEKIMGDFYK